MTRASRGSAVVMTLYLLFLMIPVYWLLTMSLKTNAEITGAFSSDDLLGRIFSSFCIGK